VKLWILEFKNPNNLVRILEFRQRVLLEKL